MDETTVNRKALPHLPFRDASDEERQVIRDRVCYYVDVDQYDIETGRSSRHGTIVTLPADVLCGLLDMLDVHERKDG